MFAEQLMLDSLTPEHLESVAINTLCSRVQEVSKFHASAQQVRFYYAPLLYNTVWLAMKLTRNAEMSCLPLQTMYKIMSCPEEAARWSDSSLGPLLPRRGSVKPKLQALG